MAVRKAEAVWEGNLKQGKGIVKLGSGAFEGAYSFSSRLFYYLRSEMRLGYTQ